MKNLSFLLLLSVAIFFSCRPDDEPDLKLSEVLTAGPWTKVVNLEDIDLDGNFVEFGDECEKDDIMIFTTDGKFEYNVGPVSCEPDIWPPNTSIGTAEWELTNHDSILVFKYFADEEENRVRSFSENELLLDLIEDNNPPGVITQRLLLKR